MNEAETRAEHIDPALKAAGWGVVEGSRMTKNEFSPTKVRAARTKNTLETLAADTSKRLRMPKLFTDHTFQTVLKRVHGNSFHGGCKERRC